MNELLHTYPIDESNEGLGSVEKVDYEDLLSDLINHDSSYKKEEGRIEGKINETTISFQYRKPKLLTLIKDRVNPSNNSELEEKTYQDTFFDVYTDIRVIEDFKIYNQEKSLDLKEIFGKDNIKIYFNLALAGGSSRFVEKQGVIWLSRNPLTRGGLTTLLHEVGHYKNSKQGSKKERAKLVQSYNKIEFARKAGGLSLPNEEDGKAVLEEEKKAWKEAIEILKPMAKDLKINLNEVEEDRSLQCLQSYEDFIAEVLKK